ncbi:MAG: TonB family protein [Oligoflexia bacterium]|nr:TonB family protein [Oligoflexia bacterium]
MLLAKHEATQRPAPRITWIEVAPPDAAKKDPKNSEETKPNQRIVQTERGELTKKAVPNAYLGEHTQAIDLETVSRSKTVKMGQTATPQVANSESRVDAKPKTGAKVAKEAAPPEKVTNLSKLGLAMIPTQKQLEKQSKEEADRPEWKSDGGNAPSDYIKGIKEGERTALNTREFVFYSYYQRIRERLDRAWVPILRQKLLTRFRSGRHIASDSDLSTRVIVVLNPTGQVVNVKITTESGLTDLDDAAISAFNQAGPFPNPPRGIVDRDGKIQIPWEFIVHS